MEDTNQLIFMTNVLRRIDGEVHNAVQVLLLVSESYKRHHKLATFKPACCKNMGYIIQVGTETRDRPLWVIIILTSGYATWFTAGGAIHIAHYDVIDDVITRKL